MHTILARGITNLTDARYFSAKEQVGYLSFNLEPQMERHLDPSLMQAMREWVQGPKITGEFSDEATAAFITEAASFYKLEAVIVAATTAGALQLPDDITVIARVQSPPSTALSRKVILLLEWPKEIQDWATPPQWLIELCAQHHVVIAYQGNADQIRALLLTLHPFGIALTGGEEEQTGVKSFDDIEEIFDVLEELEGS